MKQNELVLLEKFMLEISNADAQVPINECFKGFREYGPSDRYQMLVRGFATMAVTTREANDVGHSCISGILFGLLLAEVVGDPHIEDAIKGFCEYKRKERGEHIVDINKFKAGR